ncbi:hypothetical protein Tco_0533023 [Tanacetum coccineum]
MFVIELPLPAAPTADSEAQVLAQWNAIYDAYNEVAYLILGSMTAELHKKFENSSLYDMIRELNSMFEKQARVERFDLIQTFHACKQKEGKPVGPYVLKMKGYVEQLERLGYVLPQDISVGLILNSLTSDFVGFVRNYSMHNMGKKVGELHALLIKYEKCLPKKADTPQVMVIQEHLAKDDAFHHCKEVGNWKRNCHVYLDELIMKKKQVGTVISSGELVVMDDGKRVKVPMMRDLIRLRGKKEDVGLDELGKGGKGVVSKIGEFSRDLGSELLRDRGGEEDERRFIVI